MCVRNFVDYINEVERATLTVGGIIPWAGIPECLRRRKLAEHTHVSLTRG